MCLKGVACTDQRRRVGKPSKNKVWLECPDTCHRWTKAEKSKETYKQTHSGMFDIDGWVRSLRSKPPQGIASIACDNNTTPQTNVHFSLRSDDLIIKTSQTGYVKSRFHFKLWSLNIKVNKAFVGNIMVYVAVLPWPWAQRFNLPMPSDLWPAKGWTPGTTHFIYSK